MPEVTTLGRELIRAKLPEKYKHYASGVLDNKGITKLMTDLGLHDPDLYVDVLQDINSIGQAVVSTYGRDAALPYADARVGKSVLTMNKQLGQLKKNILNDTKLSGEQKEEALLQLGYKYMKKVQDAVLEDNNVRRTALASQINSGSRGKPVQLMQLQFGNMMMIDALNRPIPYVHTDPFISGTSPMSYWVSASSGRKGNYDVQAATGQAGYMGKQVTSATHATPIIEEDCGTDDTGVAFKASDSKNIGAVLLRPFHNHPAGSIVTDDMVSEADDDEEMILRSPLTCKSAHGVCQRCNGLSENGHFPAIGEYVALSAARSFVEPITQSGVGSKHAGGVGGAKDVDPEGEDQPTGFPKVEQFMMAPSTFQGAAVLAQEDGTVGAIRPAPQGGNYITVGQQTLYANPYRTITVKPGDKVTAGDRLTNGVPNPMELVALKGVGAGRKYFTTQLNDILGGLGWGTDRRNLESFGRAMISKVKITDPDGLGSWLPDDVVDYNEIQASWQPREDAVTTDAKKAVGKYLERPVLNYTIGTKVTPEVAEDLTKHQFNTVTVNDRPLPFESVFLRPANLLQNDEHWIPRLSGERLKDSLFDATRRGLTDEYDSTSYVDKILINPYKPN